MPDQRADSDVDLMPVLDAAWRYIYSGEDHRQETYTAWRNAYSKAFGVFPNSLVLPSRHHALAGDATQGANAAVVIDTFGPKDSDD